MYEGIAPFNGSTSATLSHIVNSAPSISSQPLPQTVSIGCNTSFSVTADGAGPFTYQWRKDGVEIPGANSATLTINDVASTDGGNYDVVVTNSCGYITSNAANLTSISAVTLTLTSQSNVLCLGAATGTINITAAGGVAPYSYSWTGTGVNTTTEDQTGLTAGTYSVTVTDAIGCATASLLVTITQPSAVVTVLISSQTNVLCYGASTGTINITVAGGAAPYTYSWTGTGVNTIAEDQTGLTAGTYSVIATDANGCATASLPVTITHPAAITINSISSNTPVCSGNTLNLFTNVSGGTGVLNYSWSGPDGFNSTLQNPSIFNVTTLANGIYTLAVTDENGCAVPATTNIAITQRSTVSISYPAAEFCSNNNTPQPVNLSGTGAYTGGIYSSSPVGLSINSSNGIITPNTSVSGTYSITYSKPATAGCDAITATTTVIITALPVATFSYTGTPFCQSSANPTPVFSGGGVAGNFTSTAGLVFVNSSTGRINLAASTPGTYIVTNTIDAANGCNIVTATSSVTITAVPTATISYAGLPFCKALNTAQAPVLSGTAAYTGGIYSASPSGLAINAASGDVTPSSSIAGTYTVTYTKAASAGCNQITATTTVIITALPVATFSYTGTPFCQSSANPAPVFSGGGVAGNFTSTAGLVFVNSSTGRINLAASTPGTYIVTNTIDAANGCNIVTATSSVTITAVPTATISYAGLPFCKALNTAQAPVLSGTAAYTGGMYSASPSGLAINAASGDVTPSSSNAGTYTVTYTKAASAGCNQITATTTVIITALPVATFSYTGTPFCQSSANPTPVFSGGGVAGNFTSTAGLVFVNSSTGRINLAASTPGTYIVTNTIDAANGCNIVTATSSVTITAVPTATISYAGLPFCKALNTAQAPVLSGTAAYTGGMYSASPSGLAINAASGDVTPSSSNAGTYTVTYTKAASAGCNQITATTTVIITALPVATFSYTGTPFCQSSANPTPVFSGGGVAGNFTSTAGLVFVNSSTGRINLAASTPGTYIVTNTIDAANGCNIVTATSSVTITAVPTATISYAGSPFCKSVATAEPVTIIGTGAFTGGTFSSSPSGLSLNAVSGFVTPATSNAGNYTVTYSKAAAGGCAAISATTSVTITTLPAATITYAASQYCSAIAAPQTVTRTGTAGGTYSSVPAGLGIDPVTGTIIPSNSTPGIYTVNYTMTANGCPPVIATRVVTIAETPIVFIGSDYCAGGGNVKLTANATAQPVTYLWSNGATTPTIMVDKAGTYMFTATTLQGCSATSFTNVARELVFNGDFSAGNTGFTSAYGNNQALFTGIPTGLWPETLYAVDSNANLHHSNFFGRDHTTGNGNFLIVNGAGYDTTTVWRQSFAVQPNTTYYFSAWAMSLNTVPPYAQLKFTVNDSLFGTTAVLAPGIPNNSGPYNWVRFYGTWNSGTNTFITISIVDLQTARGGNDFGLDDISFGTLSPYPFSAAPSGAACVGETLVLNGNVIGGASPYFYSWTGPNGFTSNAKDPIIPNAMTTHSGTYTLNVTDGYSCPLTASTLVTVGQAAIIDAGPDQGVCSGGTVTLSGTRGGSATSSTWSAPSGTFSNINSLTSTYTPSISNGTVTLTLTSNNPAGSCPAAVSTVVITVSNATANAGPDQIVCSGSTVNLSGSIGGSATSATWSAPSGTFSNINSVTSTYTPSISSGTVTLTLTTNDPPGPCGPATSNVIITVQPSSSCCGFNTCLRYVLAVRSF